MGILTGKYRPGEPPPADSRAARNPQLDGLRRQLNPEQLARVSAFAKLAREYARTPSQLALAWLLAQPGISTVIAGSTKAEHLDDNVQAADWKLAADDLRRVDEALGFGDAK